MAKIIKSLLLISFLSIPTFGFEGSKPKKPMRIISLDYCADQYVLAIAEPNQITALSKDAKLSHSFYRTKAKGHKTIRSSTDLILSLKPDLVVKTWAGDPRLKEALERLNIPLLEISIWQDNAIKTKSILEISKNNIHRVGQILGQQQTANRIIQDMETTYTRLKNGTPATKQALYVTPGAYSTGSETFMHAILQLAGVKNYMADLGYKGWSPIPVEQLVNRNPDIMITGFYDVDNAVNFNWGLARHQFFDQKLTSKPRIDVPGSYLSCTGLFAIPAADYINKKLKKLTSEKTK